MKGSARPAGWLSRLLSFYRIRDHLPVLALCVAPFVLSGFARPDLLLADLLVSFLALCYAYSLNDFFDGLLGSERNAAVPVVRALGRGRALLAAAAPGILAAALSALLPLPPLSAAFLLLFLLLFSLYSAPFPRLRNRPPLDFLCNVLAFYAIFLKSYFLHFAFPAAGFAAFSVFVLSFYSVSEAVHEAAHFRSDSAAGRRTTFGRWGKKGAAAVAAATLLPPALFWSAVGPAASATSLLFGGARIFLILTSDDLGALRKRLLGREEFLAQLAVFLAGKL